jgi:hypothetical protein
MFLNFAGDHDEFATNDLDLHQPRIPFGFGRTLTHRATSNNADRIFVDSAVPFTPAYL